MSRLLVSFLLAVFLCVVLTSRLTSGRTIFERFQDKFKDAILPHNQVDSDAATQKKADGSMLNMDFSKMPSNLKGYVNALGVSDKDILNYLKKRQETAKKEDISEDSTDIKVKK
ncbi:uncharacterized protein [Montipora foliosa]|uniref:uncharacterized protein n=1 Tax=Montipora foliosa TaxID=591990 RepID=UPI0035F211F8